MKSNQLTDLPNIGKVLEQRLHEVGIIIPDDLIALGSEHAFIRLQAVDPGACIHELMALEGAIQGIRWHDLDESKKANLKEFHRMTQKA